MGRAIFISYRRDDTEGEAGRLFDDLVRTYGENSVFMDVAGINPGVDFRKAIDDNVATCGVLLAMIGPTWTTISNGSGKRRLDDENDFVRLEIASALRRDIPVIPVLVHDAKMPRPDQLPEDLKNLAYRNSVEITHARWNSDVQLLTKALAQYVAASAETSTEPVHATVSVQLPPPNAPEKEAAPVKTSKGPLIGGIAFAVVLAIGAAIFLAVHHSAASGGGGNVTPTPVGPLPGPKPGSGPASAFAGTWTNSDSVGNNGVTKLQIAASGNQLTIHAWGKCEPVDCDWGEKTAPVEGQTATAVWNFGEMEKGHPNSRVATVTMLPANGGLHVTVVNTYKTHPENRRDFDFVRAQ